MRNTLYPTYKFAFLGLAIISATLLHPNGYAQTSAPEAKPVAAERDGSHDFDFLFGNWRIVGRTIEISPDNKEVWIDYDATAIERPFWDGRANFEEWRGIDRRDGSHSDGTATRIYNPTTHQWSIYWSMPESGGQPVVPLVGHFTDGRGEFFSQRDKNGKLTIIRYTWTSLSPDKCHWEAAVSTDGR